MSSDFFERQNDRDCTIHSLNNAMGRVVVTKEQVLRHIRNHTDAYAASHTSEETRRYRDKMAEGNSFFTAETVWKTAQDLGTIGPAVPIPGFAGEFADLEQQLPSWVLKAPLVFLGLDTKGNTHAVGARDGYIYDSQRWSKGPKPLTNHNLSKSLSRVFALFTIMKDTESSSTTTTHVVRTQPLVYSRRSRTTTTARRHSGGGDGGTLRRRYRLLQ
jgi:hypothetical protein